MMTKRQDIQKKVIEYIQNYKLIQEDELIVLGLSGGADSVCLFMMLLAYKEQCAFSMEAVHVHHGIRSEADKDAIFAKALCEKNGIPCHVIYADVPKVAEERKLSEEEAGREIRYQAFRECLQNTGKKGVIATAHHMNDQAETVLFKLFRGSGLAGLCGIRPRSEDVIRPLLCLTREEIECFLEENEATYCIDETNNSLNYTRNKIRHKILTYASQEICEGSVHHLGKTAEIMQELEDFVQNQTAKAFDECILGNGEKLILSVEKLRELDVFLQKQILMKAVYEQAGSRKDIQSVHIEGIRSLLVKEGNGSLDLPYDLLVKKEFGMLAFGKRACIDSEEGLTVENVTLLSEVVSITDKERCKQLFGCDEIQDILAVIPQKTYTKWFDYDKINGIPKLRSRCEGDYLTIDENLSKKKLKEYLIQEKIPKHLRGQYPLVADGSHIMWVIGRRISAYYKITAETKRILVLSCTTNNESNVKSTEE